MKILISGAGIGGLTTALCALHFGHSPIVLERASALEKIGAGIQISPNAFRVLEAIGLGDQILAAGFVPEAVEFRMGQTGRRMFRFPLGPKATKRWGAPYVHIHRGDLIDVLVAALNARAGDVLRLGSTVTGYVQHSDRAGLEIGGDEPVFGDVVIAADGIHSALRAQMLGKEDARFTGYLAWRATVPVRRLGDLAPGPVAGGWLGPSRHAVTYLLKGGELANFVGVVERSDWRGEAWSETGSKHEALRDFAGWHPTITSLIEEADTLYRWALFDREPLARWHDGRTALLGDACHPMLPFMAQGAAMAIEDAWTVCRALGGSSTVADDLSAYFEARQARTARVQRVSRRNGEVFHRKSLAAQAATYGPMWLAGHTAPQLMMGAFDWLYGEDVVCDAPG
ncbi:MAG: FAD-dependent monooxygenase [Pseudomonadota bacterium]